MKKTKLIGILIIILVILLTVVLFFIADLTLLNTTSNDNYVNTTNNIEKNNVQNEATSNTVSNENSTSNSVNSSRNTINSTNSVNESTTNDVFYNNEETGNAQYNANQLDNVSIEINGITEDISKHIKIQSEFIKAIKEYIYKNGLVDATAMEVEKYEYQESTGRLGIIFKLNNPDENKLRVIINANGNIDISNYN